MGDEAVERERLILDGLRRAQDVHRGGDQPAASVVVDELIATYGEVEVSRVRRRQNEDQLSADLNLVGVFGLKALWGDD